MIKVKTVYAIKNKNTGRIYVGSTSRNPVYRFNEHIRGLRNGRCKNPVMKNDYNLYGLEAFEYRTIGSYSDEEANRIELFMMYVLRTRDERYGYNQRDRHGTGKGAIDCKLRYESFYWCYPGKTFINEKGSANGRT